MADMVVVNVATLVQRIASGPCPTFWDWEQTGVNERGWPSGGNVLKCAHCRQKLHAHADGCLWVELQVATFGPPPGVGVTYERPGLIR